MDPFDEFILIIADTAWQIYRCGVINLPRD